jgi:hypothetical protein
VKETTCRVILPNPKNGIRSTDRRFGQTCVSSKNVAVRRRSGNVVRACKATGSLARYPPPPCGLFLLTTARDQVRPGHGHSQRDSGRSGGIIPLDSWDNSRPEDPTAETAQPRPPHTFASPRPRTSSSQDPAGRFCTTSLTDASISCPLLVFLLVLAFVVRDSSQSIYR